MHHRDLTKAQRRALRELAGLAHDRELSAELTKLERAFGDWYAGRIGPHELNDLIHAFHQGPSRKLHSIYAGSDKVLPVGAAVASGTIAESEVPADLAPVLASSIEAYRDYAKRGGDEAV